MGLGNFSLLFTLQGSRIALKTGEAGLWRNKRKPNNGAEAWRPPFFFRPITRSMHALLSPCMVLHPWWRGVAAVFFFRQLLFSPAAALGAAAASAPGTMSVGRGGRVTPQVRVGSPKARSNARERGPPLPGVGAPPSASPSSSASSFLPLPSLPLPCFRLRPRHRHLPPLVLLPLQVRGSSAYAHWPDGPLLGRVDAYRLPCRRAPCAHSHSRDCACPACHVSPAFCTVSPSVHGEP